ncbi:MAG TPA: four helix bundle protein [Deltaproteobacteria bacterium]|nr:four helix bundle protein [Deltaproteobacteria bacterium]
MVRNFKELIVWRKAYQLALDLYRASEEFPKSEQYGLTSQMRRCAVSIVSNVAEGYQRQHTGEYVQFLSMAYGSCAELETQLFLSKDLHYLPLKTFKELSELTTEISKMLYTMIKRLKSVS